MLKMRVDATFPKGSQVAVLETTLATHDRRYRVKLIGSDRTEWVSEKDLALPFEVI